VRKPSAHPSDILSQFLIEAIVAPRQSAGLSDWIGELASLLMNKYSPLPAVRSRLAILWASEFWHQSGSFLIVPRGSGAFGSD